MEMGRVCGNLAVSRALGDYEFKDQRDLGPEQQVRIKGLPTAKFKTLYKEKKGRWHLLMFTSSVTRQKITCLADVEIIERSPSDSFLIMACDGIWDVVSNAGMVVFVTFYLEVSVECVNDAMCRPFVAAAGFF